MQLDHQNPMEQLADIGTAVLDQFGKPLSKEDLNRGVAEAVAEIKRDGPLIADMLKTGLESI